MAHRFSTNSLIWVLGLQSLEAKHILLAARDPNRRGPLTAGGSHDRRGLWPSGPLCLAQPAQQIATPLYNCTHNYLVMFEDTTIGISMFYLNR